MVAPLPAQSDVRAAALADRQHCVYIAVASSNEQAFNTVTRFTLDYIHSLFVKIQCKWQCYIDTLMYMCLISNLARRLHGTPPRRHIITTPMVSLAANPPAY